MQAILNQRLALPVQVRAKPKAARWAVKLLFFLNGALFATWAARVPAVQAARGLNNGELGLALLAMATGAVFAMPLAGWLGARFGSDKVCKTTALIYCVLLPGLALAPNFALFALTLFGFGMVHGSLDVAMNAQAVAVEKRYQRPIMSSFHAFWSTGGLTGAAVGGLLAGQGLKPLANFTIVAVLLGGAALLTFPHLLDKAEQNAGAHTGIIAKRGPTPVFSWPTRGLLALGLIALCIMVGEGAMADWSAVYLRNSLGTKESLAAAGYAAFSIAMAGGRFLGDRLTADFGPMKLARAGALLAAGGLLLALVFHSAAVALIGFACVGLGYATIVPMVFSAAGHRPGANSDIAVASVTTLGYLGFLIGPPLIGFVAEGLGLRCALGIIVATSLVAAVLAPSLGSRLNSHPAV